MAWTPFNFFKYDPTKHDFDSTTFNIKQALNDNWDHVKALIEELRGKAVETEATPTAGSTKALTSGGAHTALAGKQNTPQMAELIMTAAGWSNGQYSLENQYQSEQYDIEIGPSKDATAEQMQAYSAALIPINPDANIVIAKGDVTSVFIALAIKVVKI